MLRNTHRVHCVFVCLCVRACECWWMRFVSKRVSASTTTTFFPSLLEVVVVYMGTNLLNAFPKRYNFFPPTYSLWVFFLLYYTWRWCFSFDSLHRTDMKSSARNVIGLADQHHLRRGIKTAEERTASAEEQPNELRQKECHRRKNRFSERKLSATINNQKYIK